MTETIAAYLLIHGLTTVGSIIIFLIRNEHRITKMETRLDYLEKSHDTYTAKGTAFLPSHPLNHPK